MFTRSMLRAVALATSCLVPVGAYAADDFAVDETTAPAAVVIPEAGSTYFGGSVGVGFGGAGGHYLGEAGRYNGVNTPGFNTGITEFDLKGGSTWSSGDTRYYSFTGSNLIFQTGKFTAPGLNSNSNWATSINNSLFNDGSVAVKIGDQGTWGFGASYDAITYTGNAISSLYTVNGGIGTLNPGLTPWGGATFTRAGTPTTYTVPTLTATNGMQVVQTGTRRDIFATDFKYLLDNWTFSGAFRHEIKNGSMEESIDTANGGTAFQLPVDYDTDRYDLIAAYNTRGVQALLQYTYTKFTDNIAYVNLPYQVSNATVPFQKSAAYSLPPSSDAHYLTVQLSDRNLIPKTTLNLNARYGWELQNAPTPPNTGDPNPTGASGASSLNGSLVGTTLPSPDITAQVYQVKASASSRPMKNVDTRIFYGLDGRSVTLNQYAVTGSGSGSDSSLGGTNYIVPQQWLKQNFGGDVGYKILPEYDTKITAGYRMDTVQRSNAQVGHSWTNTGNIAISSELGSQIDGKLSFEYADRSGTLSYLTPWENLGNSPSGQTYSGAYYQAPMTSEAVTARVDYTPLETMSASFFLQFKNENYNYPAATAVGNATATSIPVTGSGQGVKQDYALTLGPDFNYRPTKSINLHAFYTFETLFYNNTGQGACSTVAQAVTAACTGTAGFFRNNQTSNTHTVGVSGEWQVNDKLKLRGDYTVSYGSVMFSEFNGVFVTNPTAAYQNVVNYPDINSLMNTFKVSAVYNVMPNVDLVGMATYTSYHNNDWNDTANPIQGAGTTSISILTPGYAAPKYTVLAGMAAIKLKF